MLSVSEDRASSTAHSVVSESEKGHRLQRKVGPWQSSEFLDGRSFYEVRDKAGSVAGLRLPAESVLTLA